MSIPKPPPMKNNNALDFIIKATQDAILASGKKFSDIPSDSIKSFLKNHGLSDSDVGKALKSLKSFYETDSWKRETKHTEHVVETPVETHTDIKKRNPRKSIFGEIKKIM